MRVLDVLKQSEKPLFTFEIIPPLKGHTIQDVYETINSLLPFEPGYINITTHQQEVVYIDHPDGSIERRMMRRRPGTIGLSAAIEHTYGIPVVPHLICGGNTKDQLEDQLVELNFLGIENVLALRGDPVSGEKRYVKTPGGYEHTDALVAQIEALKRGEYLDHLYDNGSGISFCVGVAGYPEKHIEAPNMEKDIEMLKRKVDAGADYIVTQLFFDNDAFYRFIDTCRSHGIEVPIIPGIKPLQRKRDLELLPQTFAVDIPNSLVCSVEQASSPADIREIGVDFCIHQVEDLLKNGVPGVHFYTQGKAHAVRKVASATFSS